MRHPAAPPEVTWPWIAGAVALWLIVALAGPPAVEPVEPGHFEGTVRLDTDLHRGRYGSWSIGTSAVGRVLLEVDADVWRGDRLEVVGTIDGVPGHAAGRAYGGVLTVHSMTDVTRSRFLPHVAGRLVRRTVMRRLEPFDDARGLLAGFLIGDVSQIPDADVEAMRRSGLAHFVAVSGSNVALFLGLLAVAAGPLAIGPRRRAFVGLLGIPVYAAATGFEPSVMRASVMAAVALTGRLAGIVLEAWQLLSLCVAGLVLYDPALTSNVGFQLSVAATAGVLVGARWPVDGRLQRALAVTVGAQLAVAPLLMFHFGSVPLMSPLVNLVAAPLVAGATSMGAISVAGVTPLVGPAAWLASLVLALARGAATWPQLETWQLGLVISIGLGASRIRWTRPVIAAATAVLALATFATGGEALPAGSVTVLDVGQGDSILIHGGDGRYALVDGGPDRALLAERLHHYGVRALELVIVSHVHADHVTGLAGIVGSIPIGEVWAVTEPHTTPGFAELEEAMRTAGMGFTHPTVGHSKSLGELNLRVEGPLRRYASPNDQSLVVTVTGDSRSMLLTGDIETYAQSDLADLHADVLKVPHQGAATSDPDWLAALGADSAVISVGENDYGHPADWVIDVLEASGAEVLRTDRDGDVTVELSQDEGS